MKYKSFHTHTLEEYYMSNACTFFDVFQLFDLRLDPFSSSHNIELNLVVS